MKWLDLRIEAKIGVWSKIKVVDFTYVSDEMLLFPSLYISDDLPTEEHGKTKIDTDS